VIVTTAGAGRGTGGLHLIETELRSQDLTAGLIAMPALIDRSLTEEIGGVGHGGRREGRGSSIGNYAPKHPVSVTVESVI
jgi:hypothetical protein